MKEKRGGETKKKVDKFKYFWKAAIDILSVGEKIGETTMSTNQNAGKEDYGS
jgi:hypothetical protein